MSVNASDALSKLSVVEKLSQSENSVGTLLVDKDWIERGDSALREDSALRDNSVLEKYLVLGEDSALLSTIIVSY